MARLWSRKDARPLLSHIEINVSDLELSARFYESALKELGFFRADSEPGNYVRLSNGRDVVLVLCQTETVHLHGPSYHRKRVGLSHFAIAVESREMVDALEMQLRSLGVPLLGRGKCELGYRGGYYTLSFEDPDRIMVEVVHHPASYFAP